MLKRLLIILSVISSGAVITFGNYVETVNVVDSCRNVTFNFRNGTGKEIQITKVKYYNQSRGSWETESVPYNSCRTGQSCSVTNQDLGNAEGDNITKIKYVYKKKEGSGWSSEFDSQEFRPDDARCRAERSYGDRFDWTIGNTTSTTNSSATCRNVTFKIKNSRNVPIELNSVKYYNSNEERWQEENIPGYRVDPGETIETSRQDLNDSDRDQITMVKFVYHDIGNNERRESSTFRPTSPQCTENKVFGYGQGWAITGTASTAENNGILSGDKCRNVSFLLRNDRTGPIRIKKIKYYNRSSGKWDTIDTANSTIDGGSSRTIDSGNNMRLDGLGGNNWIDLKDADGDEITKVVFVYQQKGTSQSAKWSDNVESPNMIPSSPRCYGGKVYGQTERWTIGSSNSNSNTSSSSGEAVQPGEQPSQGSGNSGRRKRTGNSSTGTNSRINSANPTMTQGTMTTTVANPAGSANGKNKGKNKNKNKGKNKNKNDDQN